MNQKVILIAGPAGSGKTSMAKRIAKNKGWVHISEDDFWAEMKKGHPEGELRTEKEQTIVQQLALQTIMNHIKKGKNVVFEFILYENPPKPLMFYRSELLKRNIEPIIRVLKPNACEIMIRKKKRGRADDQEEEIEHERAEHQLKCLKSKWIMKEWVIDNSDLTVEENYQKNFMRFIEE